MTFILKIVVFFRRLFEPLTWNIFKPSGWEKLPDLDTWDTVKEYDLNKFNLVINNLKYKADPHSGLFDYSFPLSNPQYFFKDLKSGRDCDDWSRIWVCYYLHHNGEVEEWVVTSKKHPFKSSHFVAVAKEKEGYRLLNYRKSDTLHSTVEEALDELSNWGSGQYSKSNRVQCLYKRYSRN